MNSRFLFFLTFIFFTLTSYSQETIRIYRVGSSSFSNKLAQQIEDMIEAGGNYSVEWGDAGYTRMDQWADGEASYSAWIDAKMPEITLGNYDYVIVQTISWFTLTPAQQDTLFMVTLPDLRQKVNDAGAELILYDKYPSPGCYPDWVRCNYLFHMKAGVEAGIDKIAFGGYAMRYLRETPYFDGMLSFYDMTGHPGPMTDYFSACAISYMITGVDPIGSSMTNISIMGFCNDWFADQETNNPTFYNANKDRVVNEHLQLTAWEADTLQKTAMWSHLGWTDTLNECMTNPTFYQSILDEIEAIRAQHGQWETFDNPGDYSDLSRERCNPLDAITLSENVLLAILDTIKMFSDRVETAAQTYLTSGEYDQLKQDYEDYWQDYNSKFRDDTYYMLLVELEMARADSTPDLAEITRLEEQSDVFREILSLPAEQMLIDLLNPTDSAAFVSSFTWGTPLSTYASEFGQAQIDNASDWKEVEVLREMYTDIWINNDLMDAARDNSYPLDAWLDVDSIFADEYASFVPGFRTLQVSGNGLYQTITISPDQVSYALGSSVTISTSTYLGYEFKNWSGDASGTADPLTVTMDENKSITANFGFVDDGIIIDNDAGFPTCIVGNGTIDRTGDANTFGANALKLKVEPDVKVRWAPNFSGIEGEYEIFVWYPVGGSTDAPYYISHDGGTDLINFDQSSGDGVWQSLGKYNMSAGSYLELDASISTGSRPLADAARFVYTGVAYSLNITADDGSVSRSPNKATYSQDEVVNLTATPDPGYSFDNWSGDASGSANPVSITMDANKNVTANFSQNTYTITFNVDDGTDPIQNADVTFNSTTISTDASGNAVFSNVVYGTGLAYSIVASGFNTASGIVDATADVTEEVTMTAVAPGTYTVTFTVDDGTNTIEGANVSFNSQDVLTNASGEAVFAGVLNGTGLAYTVTISGYDSESGTVDVADADVDETVSLTLTAAPTYAVTITSGTGSGDYEEGVTVNISADAAPMGQEFDTWTGDVSLLSDATATASSFTMPANAVSITATYKDIEIIDAVCDNELIFDVYPNPASNVVIISSNVNMEYVQFINVNGKLVLEGELNSQRSAINISQIPKGMYFINLNLEDNTHQIVRFIKH